VFFFFYSKKNTFFFVYHKKTCVVSFSCGKQNRDLVTNHRTTWTSSTHPIQINLHLQKHMLIFFLLIEKLYFSPCYVWEIQFLSPFFFFIITTKLFFFCFFCFSLAFFLLVFHFPCFFYFFYFLMLCYFVVLW